MNYIISEKQRGEKEAVKKFLTNQGIEFNDSLVDFPQLDDYVDVIYNNVKYQVTRAPAGMLEVNGRLNKEAEVISKQNNQIRGRREFIGGLNTKWMDWTYNIDKGCNDYICYPISNKKEQYIRISMSEKITLLIHSSEADPPLEWLKSWIDGIKKSDSYYHYLRDLNFKFIYLVLTKENIQIFP